MLRFATVLAMKSLPESEIIIFNGPERIRVKRNAFATSSFVFSLYGWMLMT